MKKKEEEKIYKLRIAAILTVAELSMNRKASHSNLSKLVLLLVLVPLFPSYSSLLTIGILVRLQQAIIYRFCFYYSFDCRFLVLFTKCIYSLSLFPPPPPRSTSPRCMHYIYMLCLCYMCCALYVNAT